MGLRSSKISVIVFLLISLVSLTVGQEVTIKRLENSDFRTSQYFFDQKLYLHAQQLFEEIAHGEQGLFDLHDKNRRMALLDGEIAGIRIENPKSENLIKQYVLQYYPDPVTIPAILELASFYFYNNQFKTSIEWYDKIELDALPELDKSEAYFKKGYSAFVLQDFKLASRSFEKIVNYNNIFYYPSNYYFAMTKYFLQEYDTAVEYFKKVSNSTYYGNYIPYYLCQIYFSREKYDLLLSYGEAKITEPSVQNKKDIRLLLGQAYYLRSDYSRAIKHLEFYEANTEKLTIEQFYQLAFTQYQLKKYKEASKNFSELTYLDTKLGQLSNYYLADCYIRLKDFASAKSVLKKVSQMSFDTGMQKEAEFNYAKLSTELGNEREAINVLANISNTSPYFDEAQGLIKDILVNSGDYSNSIRIMESLPSLTNQLKETYQNITLKKAIQSYAEGDLASARDNFDKSLKYKSERLYEAQVYYWLAKMAYESDDISKTIGYLDQYHEKANGLADLPEESSGFMANYLKGYCQLRTGNFKEAEIQFKNAVVGINISSDYITNDAIQSRVLPDAMLRTADCQFKNGKYNDAFNFYGQIVERGHFSADYALYQRANINGLTNRPFEKIIELEKLIKNYPNSSYVDDAYYHIGEVYAGMGDLEKAAYSYIDLLAKFGLKSPYYNGTLMKMGLLNYNRGNLNKSLEYYKTVVSNNPSIKELQEARKAIEEIYVKDLGNSKGYFAYLDSIPGFEITDFSKDSLSFYTGYLQYEKGDFVKAMEGLNDYISRFPGGFFRTEAIHARAEIYLAQKDYSKALMDYDQVIAAGKGSFYSVSLRKALLIAYNHDKDFKKVLRYLPQYEPFFQSSKEAYEMYNYGLNSAVELTLSDQIILYAQKVRDHELATVEDRANALYYIGRTAYATKEYEKGLAAFSQTSQLVNNNKAAEARYYMSKIYFEQGNFELAEKQCNYNNENSINYPYWVAKSILLLSDIYMLRGDLINARAAIEAVIENFEEDEGLQKSAKEKLSLLEEKEKAANRIKPVDGGVLEMDSIKKN